MTIMIVLANTVLAALVLLFGFLYPTFSIWSYFAVGLIGFHLVLQLVVAKAQIFEAAKISVFTIQVLSLIASMIFLFLFKFRLGDLWALVAMAVVGCTLLTTVVALITMKSPNS
jgi:hypothetical protein